MENNKMILKKQFSELQPWQTQYTLVYELQPSMKKDGKFGVKICEVHENKSQSAHYAEIFSTWQQAETFLRFLYENAISPTQLECVVQDLNL